jgi:hypothetical protein
MNLNVDEKMYKKKYLKYKKKYLLLQRGSGQPEVNSINSIMTLLSNSLKPPTYNGKPPTRRNKYDYESKKNNFNSENNTEEAKKKRLDNFKNLFGNMNQDYKKTIQGDTEFFRTVVKLNGLVLDSASNELKENRELVLDASIENPFALQFASDKLKGDKTFILDAIDTIKKKSLSSDTSLPLKFASDKLKEDRDFISKIIKINPLALQYASNELRGDRDLVLVAVKLNGFALGAASDKLKGDYDIILAAVTQTHHALKFANMGALNPREQLELKSKAINVAEKLEKTDF